MSLVAITLAAALQIGPIDWNALPVLPLRSPPAITPAMNAFVGREAVSRHCKVQGTARRGSLTVDVAMLIDGSGELRTAIPRAINCPTVEQYAAGLAAGFARGNMLPRVGDNPLWYKTSLTFSWQR
ncbi:hypothetical protein ACFQ1E_07255 [Sphingomonas canadensis]|uniref:TonB C-terminal domain-containing protein n=1 Tax=Sphingomonas canadensis TaxID=1219257 RepID=A0ABW3H5J2_9SPHN|nr:hypothetical protein [Sphingomonas canadensis]MCW3835418.1 hypothetical protein [Sphingomonas canadensis]